MNLADFGRASDSMTRNTLSVLDYLQRDKQLKNNEQYNNILQQKAKFEFDTMKKNEEKLSKKFKIGDFFRSQGALPEVVELQNSYLKSTGLMGDDDAIELRNLPMAMQTMGKAPELRIQVNELNHAYLTDQYDKLNTEAVPKLREKIEREGGNFEGNEEWQKLQSQISDIRARKSKIEKDNEIWKRMVAKSTISPKDRYIDWGYGQKKDVVEGTIYDVPVKPEEKKLDKIIEYGYGQKLRQKADGTESVEQVPVNPKESSDRDERDFAKKRTNILNSYNKAILNLRARYDNASKSGLKMSNSDWNSALHEIYNLYQPQFAEYGIQWVDTISSPKPNGRASEKPTATPAKATRGNTTNELPDPSKYKEGTTATDRVTGEKHVVKGGKWVKVNNSISSKEVD